MKFHIVLTFDSIIERSLVSDFSLPSHSIPDALVKILESLETILSPRSVFIEAWEFFGFWAVVELWLLVILGNLLVYVQKHILVGMTIVRSGFSGGGAVEP